MIRARDNPFATERVLRLRYQFDSPEAWSTLLNRLNQFHYRASIVGPHGSGKTTLLEDLGERLKQQGFNIYSLFLNEQNRAYPVDFVRTVAQRATSSEIVLFDGCEQLSALNWWRFRWNTRRAGGLIVTTHRPGRLPVLWRCSTNPELLANLISQLTPESSPETPDIQHLYDAHRGNIRDALRELYDGFQSLR